MIGGCYSKIKSFGEEVLFKVTVLWITYRWVILVGCCVVGYFVLHYLRLLHVLVIKKTISMVLSSCVRIQMSSMFLLCLVGVGYSSICGNWLVISITYGLLTYRRLWFFRFCSSITSLKKLWGKGIVYTEKLLSYV